MSNSIFSKSPFRQGQLVTPFGVGSMSVTKSGVGIIVAGLDYWYPDDDFFHRPAVSEPRPGAPCDASGAA